MAAGLATRSAFSGQLHETCLKPVQLLQPVIYAVVNLFSVKVNYCECVLLQPDPEDDDFRYVPDLTLMELKAQAAELEKAKEDRKKK